MLSNIDFGSYFHTKKYEKGLSTGGDKIADWGGSKGGWGGHVPPSLYVKRGPGSFNAWFLIPQITRSRFRPSFRFSNSHVEARVRNTVTYCRVDGVVFCLIANIKFVSLVCHVFLRATILSECFSQLLSRSFPYWPSVFARPGFRFRKC